MALLPLAEETGWWGHKEPRTAATPRVSANHHTVGTNWQSSTTDCITHGEAMLSSSNATAQDSWHGFYNIIITLCPWST